MFVSKKDFSENIPQEDRFESACLGVLGLTFPMAEKKRVALTMHIRQGFKMAREGKEYAGEVVKARLKHDLEPYASELTDKELSTMIIDNFAGLLARDPDRHAKAVEELCQGILVSDEKRRMMVSHTPVVLSADFDRQKS